MDEGQRPLCAAPSSVRPPGVLHVCGGFFADLTPAHPIRTDPHAVRSRHARAVPPCPRPPGHPAGRAARRPAGSAADELGRSRCRPGRRARPAGDRHRRADLGGHLRAGDSRPAVPGRPLRRRGDEHHLLERGQHQAAGDGDAAHRLPGPGRGGPPHQRDPHPAHGPVGAAAGRHGRGRCLERRHLDRRRPPGRDDRAGRRRLGALSRRARALPAARGAGRPARRGPRGGRRLRCGRTAPHPAGPGRGHRPRGPGAQGAPRRRRLPRPLLVSAAAAAPGVPPRTARTGPVPPRAVGLRVALDSALPGQALASGATKQTGVVMVTDVLATVLASYDATAEGLIPGQPFRGIDHDDPQQLAWDRSEAARLVDGATLPALGSFLALGVIGVVISLVPPLARRPRTAAVGRALAAIAPLALPVGMFASVVPWWRADHPALALTGVIWAGSALLSVLVLAGPWRRHRFGPAGVSAALVAGLLLGESATGSKFQLASPLGAQPISGGRFYGLSNHLFGMVLASALMAVLCLFTVVRTPRARTVWTLVVGVTVAAVCVSPSMGADFGSMLPWCWP